MRPLAPNRERARQALVLERFGEWQAEHLLQSDVVGDVLARIGYRREASWRQPYRFQPRMDGTE